MKRLISALRALDASEASFDETFMTLMREVLHHVAHEETVLLPEAERQLSNERLSELGAEMTRRRLELAAPRAGEIALNAARSYSAPLMVAGGAIAVGALVAALTRNQARSRMRA